MRLQVASVSTRAASRFKTQVTASVLLCGQGYAVAQSQFDVPATCGDRVQFEASIRGRLGSEAGALLDALAVALEQHTDGSYILTLRVGEVTRIVQDNSCEELLRAAVVMAIALWDTPARPHRETSSQAPATPAIASSVATPAPAAPPLPAAAPPAPVVVGPWVTSSPLPRDHVQRQWHLALELGIISGLQPNVSPFFGLRGAYESGSVGVRGSLRGVLPSSERDANGRGVRVVSAGALASLYFKPLPELGVETGLAAYALRGRGLGSREQASDSIACFGPLIGVWLIPVQTEFWRVLLGAEGQGMLNRAEFEILEYGRVFRVSAITGSAYLAAGYRFW